MKTIRLSLLLLPSLALAAPFEGVLDGKMTGPHATGTTHALVSAEGLRNEVLVESPAARAAGRGKVQAVSLYRSAEPEKVYVLDPAAKTYRVDPAVKKRGPERTWTVERQGKGEVAGLPCEKAVLTTAEGDRIDACLSTEIGAGTPWLRALQDGEGGVGAGSSRALAKAGLVGYPLRWALQAKGGVAAISVEVTAAERRPVPASTFAVPADFKPARAAAAVKPAAKR